MVDIFINMNNLSDTSKKFIFVFNYLSHILRFNISTVFIKTVFSNLHLKI